MVKAETFFAFSIIVVNPFKWFFDLKQHLLGCFLFGG